MVLKILPKLNRNLLNQYNYCIIITLFKTLQFIIVKKHRYKLKIIIL